MKILVRLNDELTARKICRLLAADGHYVPMHCEESRDDWFSPDVLLVDMTTLNSKLLARYPKTTVFLVDNAEVTPEKLYAALLTYRAAGVLPSQSGLQRVWIDQGSVKVGTTGVGMKTDASAALNVHTKVP